jgi:hypothetical protein
MKNLLTKFFFLWLLFFSNYEAIVSQNLIVQQTNGTENSLSLSAIRKLVFNNNSLQITNISGNSTDFLLSDVRKIFFSNTSSSENIIVNEKLVIYPNPATSELNIIVNDPVPNSIEIYNFQGRKIKTEIVNDDLERIDINDLQSGIYLIKAGLKTTKFVKL